MQTRTPRKSVLSQFGAQVWFVSPLQWVHCDCVLSCGFLVYSRVITAPSSLPFPALLHVVASVSLH